MLTDKEIKEAANENTRVNSGVDEVRSFTHGAKFAQDKMLEMASEGFEEWYSQHEKVKWNYSGYGSCEEAWQAARLASAKEIEELKKDLEFLAETIDLYFINEVKIHPADNVRAQQIRQKWKI